MKRRAILFTLAAIAVAAMVVGYRAYERRPRPMEWSGTVEARTVQVGSRVGGRVKEVLVREGDWVKSGQALIILEPGDLEAQRLQALGQLQQAQGNLAKVADRRAGARLQEIAAARARLKAQEVAVEKAQLDLSRTEKLFANGAATGVERDNADIALRNALAQRDALKAQLDELLRGTPEDVKSLQGQVDMAKGRLDQNQTMLDELTIRAPRAAQVVTLDLRPGDILAPSAVAAKLLETDQLYVRIYVPETQLGFVHPSKVVTLYVDSFPNRPFKAVVESISHEGEYTPRNLQTADERADQVFAARLRIEEGKDVLRAGMAAIARVTQ
jgi:multidrug resistance efflux pump